MKNIGQMMKQAQEMQSKMGEIQEKLAETVVEGASGGGMVQVTMSAKGEIKTLKIDPTLIKPEDAEMLEDLIVAACTDAKDKADATMAEEMSKLTGGLPLPPGFKLF